MSNYETIVGFEGVYLEDSWVLGVHLEPGLAVLEVDVVLTESHPQYTAPSAGEQFCYRRAQIRFEEVSSVCWTGQGLVKAAVDATGERDFGSIDEFEVDGDSFSLEGDFGRLEIESRRPGLHLL
ncbi:hypothetical protein [Promicromonospora sp. NPDC023805]|uniref:hypothetical protein n=1 Tax=Promicromonospora sp. NPDC023805 TaxID=3154696 RepID=UPI0033CBACFE